MPGNDNDRAPPTAGPGLGTALPAGYSSIWAQLLNAPVETEPTNGASEGSGSGSGSGGSPTGDGNVPPTAIFNGSHGSHTGAVNSPQMGGPDPFSPDNSISANAATLGEGWVSSTWPTLLTLEPASPAPPSAPTPLTHHSPSVQPSSLDIQSPSQTQADPVEETANDMQYEDDMDDLEQQQVSSGESFASYLFAPYTAHAPDHHDDSLFTGPPVPFLPLPTGFYSMTIPHGNGHAVHHFYPTHIASQPPLASDTDGAEPVPHIYGEPPAEPNPEPALPVPVPEHVALPVYGQIGFADTSFTMEVPMPMAAPGGPVTFTNTSGALMNSELTPTNADLKRFLLNWQASTRMSIRGTQTPRGPVPTVVPSVTGTEHLFYKDVDVVTEADLNGDHCDFQGIKWAAMGVTRREARTTRLRRYRNYCFDLHDSWRPSRLDLMPQNTETYFRFQRMRMRKAPYLAHFQLRNLLVAPSKTHVFYADRQSLVRRYNFATDQTGVVLKYPSNAYIQISTIAGGHGALVSGGFNGEYCTKNTDYEYNEKAEPGQADCGVFTNLGSGISNHIQVYSARNSGGAVAALASNDCHVRVMDLKTQAILSDHCFPFPINSTAVSPDKKLRVVVGDFEDAFIVAADQRSSSGATGEFGNQQPEVLQRLGGHKDFSFACAWADDGYTIATGNQDRAIKIWDARKTVTSSGIWTPIATLRSTMAGVRSLQFSPIGSGKRVLVAAEEADFLHVIDAQTFDKRQSFDVFGELAGVSFSDNGQDLFALCTDQTRGGIMHFARDGLLSAASTFDEKPVRGLPGYSNFDWPDMHERSARQRHRVVKRRMRTAASAMDPF